MLKVLDLNYPWMSAEDMDGNQVLVSLVEVRMVIRDKAHAQTIVHAAGLPWPCRIPDKDGDIHAAICDAVAGSGALPNLMPDPEDVPEEVLPPGTFDQFEKEDSETRE
jgi:hypothetical protein